MTDFTINSNFVVSGMKIFVLLAVVVFAVIFYLAMLNRNLSHFFRHQIVVKNLSPQSPATEEGEENVGNRKHRTKSEDGLFMASTHQVDSTTATLINNEQFMNLRADEEQVKRQNLLRDFCHKHGNKPYKSAHRSMIYSDRQEVLYCSVAKAACTSWKRMMPVFDGKIADPMDFKSKEEVHRYRHSWLSNVKNKTEVERRKRDYFKFFFVRHPFQRLLSAYRNKFLNPYNDAYQRIIGPKIAKYTRPNSTLHEGESVKDIKFSEFVDYILYLHYVKKTKFLDHHWGVAHNLCDPCNVQYDFIGKVETLEEDANQVLRRIGLYGKVKFPIGAKDKYKTTIEDIMKDYFTKLPKSTVKKLYELYEYDFVSFGYELPEYL